MVVAVDRSWVVGTPSGTKWQGGGEEGFDGLVAKNDEGGHRPETVDERLVAAGVSEPANDVFAAKLLRS